MPSDGEVRFEAGGEVYTAVFGFKAMRAAEDHYDMPLMEAIRQALPQVGARDMKDKAAMLEAGAKMRFSDFGKLFSFALLKHHPQLTEDDIDDICDELGLQGVAGVIGQSFAAMMAREGDGGSTQNPPRKGSRQPAK